MSIESLAEALVDIDADIEDAKVAKNNAESPRQYFEIEGIIESLRADRQAIVEQLESLGLEDPDL